MCIRDRTVTTREDGTIKVENLQPGTYTVTALTENRYEPQKAQTVEVTAGKPLRWIFPISSSVEI